jgi:hypothetical protein
MKSLPIFALVVAGLLGACSYRHETVERPAPAPVAAVATPAPVGTVVYTDPSGATTTSSSTTVYSRY